MLRLTETYDDDYQTCEKTFATLRIYPGDIKPENITLPVIGFQPVIQGGRL